MKKKLFLMNSEEDWNEYFVCGGKKPKKHWVCVDTETGKIVDEKGDSIGDLYKNVLIGARMSDLGVKYDVIADDLKLKSIREAGEKIGVIEYVDGSSVETDDVYKVDMSTVGYKTKYEFVTVDRYGWYKFHGGLTFDEIISNYEKRFKDVDYREGV